jgi:hypothetical protein
VTVPRGVLFGMSAANVAFDRALIGPLLYLGTDDAAAPAGWCPDIWAGWCIKVLDRGFEGGQGCVAAALLPVTGVEGRARAERRGLRRFLPALLFCHVAQPLNLDTPGHL